MPDQIETTAVVPEGQTAASVEEVASTTATPSEELFFDASKVPDALRPTFKEMQSAWTKKTQEAAERSKQYEWMEEFGEADEVRGFLDQFRSQEGVFQWFVAVAQELGISQEALAGLLSGSQGGGQVSPDPADNFDEPMTRREFQEYQARSQREAYESREDQEVDAALQSLGVEPDLEPHVLAAALRQPKHLGYSERIKRGHAEVQKLIEAKAAGVAGRKQALNDGTPGSLEGTTPTGSEGPPKTLEEAGERAKAIWGRRTR